MQFLRRIVPGRGAGAEDANEAPARMIGRYRLGETLGVGGYSKVKLGFDTENNRKVALKIMMADEETGEISESHKRQLVRELAAMKKVQHENVIQLYEYDPDALYPKHDGSVTPCVLTVLELAPGGELFDFLMFTGHFDEVTSRTYFHQLMGGIGACHDAGLAHRDIKPENLLLDGNFVLKIADFGFAREFRSGDVEFLMGTACGTRGYLAPELLRGEKYGHKADLFACGIILFTLFAGFPPFQHALPTDWWWHKLELQNYPLFWMAHERTRTFPDPLKELLQSMLHSDPNERFDMPQIVESAWYNGPTLTPHQLTKHLTKRKKLVRRERAKKVRAEQQKNEGQDRPNAVTRAVTKQPDMPEGVPPMSSLFRRQAENLGTFETFALAMDDLKEAEFIDCNFQFLTNADPRESFARIKAVAESMGSEVQVSPEINLMLIHAGVASAASVQTVVVAVKQFFDGNDNFRVLFKRYQGDPMKYHSVLSQIFENENMVDIMKPEIELAELEADPDLTEDLGAPLIEATA